MPYLSCVMSETNQQGNGAIRRFLLMASFRRAAGHERTDASPRRAFGAWIPGTSGEQISNMGAEDEEQKGFIDERASQ